MVFFYCALWSFLHILSLGPKTRDYTYRTDWVQYALRWNQRHVCVTVHVCKSRRKRWTWMVKQPIPSPEIWEEQARSLSDEVYSVLKDSQAIIVLSESKRAVHSLRNTLRWRLPCQRVRWTGMATTSAAPHYGWCELPIKQLKAIRMTLTASLALTSHSYAVMWLTEWIQNCKLRNEFRIKSSAICGR